MSKSPMKRETWERVEVLFDAVCALDPAARAQYLREHCDDALIRGEVESLLDAEPTAPEYLDGGAVALAGAELSSLEAETAGLEPGTQLGPYRIVEKIGQGGMSLVYLGERHDDLFARRVAVKLLRRADLGIDHRLRFGMERRILASLDHPLIARIFDAGLTPTGWPYIVMEYVDGETITVYSAKRQLPLTERLALFQKVCGAVHHAHQRLIVHRDLKPSNVLVTADGSPKLLDFGIAKLLDSEPGDELETMPGTLLMTPEYAAPEQVRGEAITTATDVYALGLMLYELLTGSRPYSIDGLSTRELERVVCGTEPPLLSAQPTASASIDPAVLRGDLDTICLKALRKEPERRYSTALELSDDLERYLVGLPVEARPPTTGYRAKKFVRRNRGLVGSVLAAFLLISGFAAFMALQRAQTAQARDAALLESAVAREVTEFLLELFDTTTPETSLGRDLSASDLLRRGVERIDAVQDQPQLQARLLGAMGVAHDRLGEYDTAEPLLRRSFDLHRSTGEADPTEAAVAADNLGVTLRRMGRLPESETLHRDAVAQLSPAGTSAELATATAHLGVARQEQGDYAQAESLLTVALGMVQETRGPEHADALSIMNDLAVVIMDRGDSERAQQVHQELLEIRVRTLGERHPTVAISHHNLGYIARYQGDYAAAELHYGKAIEIRREVLGPEHPLLASTLDNLAIVFGLQGRYDDARPLFEEALRIRRAAFGEMHPLVATSLGNLATLAKRTGDLDQSIDYRRRGLDIRLAVLGEEHPLTAQAMDELGMALAERGELQEGTPMVERALEISRRVYGEKHREVAAAMSSLATLLARAGELDRAVELDRQVLALRRELYGPEHPTVATSLRSLGHDLMRRGDDAESEQCFLESLELRKKLLGDQHDDVAEVMDHLGQLYTKRGRYDDAETFLRQAREIRVAALGPAHPLVAETDLHLAALRKIAG